MLRLLATLSMIVAGGGAAAQAIDEAWIVERVVAGRYDELRKVEAASDAGSPVAMHWWGRFKQACIFAPCDGAGALALWMKAAQAGHAESKAALLASVRSRAELDDLMAKIGAPSSVIEKAAYAAALAGVATLAAADDSYVKSRDFAREFAASEPRMVILYGLTFFDGPRNVDMLRAVVEAGYPRAAETFIRALMLRGTTRYEQQLAMAKGGDLAMTVALCQTVEVRQGYIELPADLLAMCERALAQGHIGVTPALLRHHAQTGNRKAAAFYADLCASLLAACSSDLAEYYRGVYGDSPQWRLWDAVAGLAAGVAPEEAKLPTELMRQAFSILVRNGIAERACGLRRYDAAAKKFEDDPACHYRRASVTIPAEFLGAR